MNVLLISTVHVDVKVKVISAHRCDWKHIRSIYDIPCKHFNIQL
jgi:hypothetical protein